MKVIGHQATFENQLFYLLFLLLPKKKKKKKSKSKSFQNYYKTTLFIFLSQKSNLISFLCHINHFSLLFKQNIYN
jgi:hypothetical protein